MPTGFSPATRGAVSGLASALLFGVSAPLAKLLLPRIDSWVLAGLLYLGAGLGLSAVRLVQRASGRSSGAPPLTSAGGEWPLLIAIAAIGGGAGPLLMLTGLRHLSGVAGALLLNLEAVFTMLLAVTVFRERLTRLEMVAASIVLAGAALVSLRSAFDSGGVGIGIVSGDVVGFLAVSAACLAWGLDNNLTTRLSHRDALALVQFKTLTAGAGNLALALIAGHVVPAAPTIAASFAVGFVCYGLSIVLDVYALRYIGAAREAAFFATAPFAGAIAAVPLLREPVTANELAGAAVMALGVAAMVRARTAGDGAGPRSS